MSVEDIRHFLVIYDVNVLKKTHSSYFETTQHGFERFFKEALVAAART